MYQLTLHWKENNQIQIRTIDSQRYTILGRDPSCNIVVNPDDLKISREHIKIYFNVKEHNFYLCNLKGRDNPIKLNGTIITNQFVPLSKGSNISIGNYTNISISDIINLGENTNKIRLEWYDIHTGKKEGIYDPPIAIGRDMSSLPDHVPIAHKIVLNNVNVSRFHALIELQNNQLMIVDNNTTNKTYINGQKITQAIINHGDKIKIDTYEFTLEIIPPHHQNIIPKPINNPPANSSINPINNGATNQTYVICYNCGYKIAIKNVQNRNNTCPKCGSFNTGDSVIAINP
jgi:pSer/pThr/pTyr-binding forkhead associated (FHA) protein